MAGVDARGFLVAAAVATRLEVGVLAVRKGGKLPRPVLSEEYYRSTAPPLWRFSLRASRLRAAVS